MYMAQLLTGAQYLWWKCFTLMPYTDLFGLCLTLLHPDWPKLHWILTILNVIGMFCLIASRQSASTGKLYPAQETSSSLLSLEWTNSCTLQPDYVLQTFDRKWHFTVQNFKGDYSFLDKFISCLVKYCSMGRIYSLFKYSHQITTWPAKYFQENNLYCFLNGVLDGWSQKKKKNSLCL